MSNIVTATAYAILAALLFGAGLKTYFRSIDRAQQRRDQAIARVKGGFTR